MQSDDPGLLGTKHVADLLGQLQELEKKLDFPDFRTDVLQRARATPASVGRKLQEVHKLPTISECQPDGKPEQQTVAVVASSPLHPLKDVPCENVQEINAEMSFEDKQHDELPLESEPDKKHERLVELERSFECNSSGLPSNATLKDVATHAISTMQAAGLLSEQSMSSPVGEERKLKHDVVMKRLVLAEDVPQARTPRSVDMPADVPPARTHKSVDVPVVPSEMSRTDDVLINVPPQSNLRWPKTLQAASGCLPHELVPGRQTLKDEAAYALALLPQERSLSHERIPSERTLQDEAAHALALGKVSSAAHRATLPPSDRQSASTCAYRSSVSKDAPSPSLHSPMILTDRSTASSNGQHSKDSLGSVSSRQNSRQSAISSRSLRSPRQSAIESRRPRSPSTRSVSPKVVSDERVVSFTVDGRAARSAKPTGQRLQSHRHYFNERPTSGIAARRPMG